MNPESSPGTQSTAAPSPAYKLYGLNSMWPAAFIGGPMMGTYVLADNFKKLGDSRRARWSWIIGTVFTVVLFAALLLFPAIEEKIPKYILPALYCSAAYGLMFALQRAQLEKHTDDGGRLFGGWRVLGIALLWMIGTVAPVFAIGYYADPFHEVETIQFGKQHEIYYFPEEMTATEVNKLGSALRQTWLFDESSPSGVLARKGNHVIEIDVVLIEGACDDAAARSDFSALRDYVQQFFPDDEIVFNLCADYGDVRTSVRANDQLIPKN